MEPVPIGAQAAEPPVKAARELARGRIVLGAFVFAAPRVARRVFGFPARHETDSAITFARLYALREVAFGLQLWWEAGRGGPRVETVRLNTALDAADAVMCWVLVARRRDLGRGALTVAVFASVVTWQWWRLLRRMERAEAGG